MHLEEFALGDSIVHKLDPRVKIIVAALFSVIVALSSSLHGTLLSICFPFALILLARLDMKKVLTRLVVVNTFVGFLWLFLPFTEHGEVIYTLGPLEVYREGVLHALLITIKSNSIVLVVIALLGTSSVHDLVHGLHELGAPNKLVHLFFFCFRYIHVVHEEYHRLVNAMKMRGFKPRTNMHTYRTYSYLVGMLLVKSFDRSARILSAMECRGFRGTFYVLEHREIGRRDYVVCASSILISLMIVTLR